MVRTIDTEDITDILVKGDLFVVSVNRETFKLRAVTNTTTIGGLLRIIAAPYFWIRLNTHRNPVIAVGTWTRKVIYAEILSGMMTICEEHKVVYSEYGYLCTCECISFCCFCMLNYFAIKLLKYFSEVLKNVFLNSRCIHVCLFVCLFCFGVLRPTQELNFSLMSRLTITGESLQFCPKLGTQGHEQWPVTRGIRF